MGHSPAIDLSVPGTVLVISHDRWFLDRIATHVMTDAGEREDQEVFFEGNYQQYEENHRKRLSAAGEDPDRPHRMKYNRLA